MHWLGDGSARHLSKFVAGIALATVSSISLAVIRWQFVGGLWWTFLVVERFSLNCEVSLLATVRRIARSFTSHPYRAILRHTRAQLEVVTTHAHRNAARRNVSTNSYARCCDNVVVDVVIVPSLLATRSELGREYESDRETDQNIIVKISFFL